MLLRDYAITPDVFDGSCYPHVAACDAELRHLKAVLLEEGLVRNLRGGEWLQCFGNTGRPWHKRGSELLRKLAKNSRLIESSPCLKCAPVDDEEWCREALESHAKRPLKGGCIVTRNVKERFATNVLVASIDRLQNAPWWQSRSSSIHLERTIENYVAHLELVLHHANSLMFIDPYLDPDRPGYQGFPNLLRAAGRRSPAPCIEIHRVCWADSSDKRMHEKFRRLLVRNFCARLRVVCEELGTDVKVFLWDNFHDRYLISDLIGIQLANGFDTPQAGNTWTTWTRLGRKTRDEIQRQFDPAQAGDRIKYEFLVRG